MTDPVTKPKDIKILDELTKKVSIRESHPNMYRVLMIIAVMSIALAINLYFTKPTFTPYSLSNVLIASIFLGLGVSQVILLNLYRNLRMVRLTTAFSVSFMMFWGVSNTQQSFAGKASFQLPILLISLAILQIPLLVEPVANPLTKKTRMKLK